MLDKIKKAILNLISKRHKIPREIDVDSFNYIDTGYIDSMSLIKFTVELEAEFSVEISEDDMMSPEFRTIGGLASIIEKKAAKNKCH